MSVIISAFGIVNTLTLSIFERTRELGLLRAVGMTRRDVRRMVRYESVITAVFGALLGLVLGLFFAFVVIQAIGSEGLTFSLPIGQIVSLMIFAIVVGVVAAIFPARRASRLDVLRALAYE
jgi:putative ABC transport system permease protein